jgi:hypothetical protein
MCQWPYPVQPRPNHPKRNTPISHQTRHLGVRKAPCRPPREQGPHRLLPIFIHRHHHPRHTTRICTEASPAWRDIFIPEPHLIEHSATSQCCLALPSLYRTTAHPSNTTLITTPTIRSTSTTKIGLVRRTAGLIGRSDLALSTRETSRTGWRSAEFRCQCSGRQSPSTAPTSAHPHTPRQARTRPTESGTASPAPTCPRSRSPRSGTK